MWEKDRKIHVKSSLKYHSLWITLRWENPRTKVIIKKTFSDSYCQGAALMYSSGIQSFVYICNIVLDKNYLQLLHRVVKGILLNPGFPSTISSTQFFPFQRRKYAILLYPGFPRTSSCTQFYLLQRRKCAILLNYPKEL